MTNLTEKQEETLRFIFDTYIKTEKVPTYREIASAAGISVSAAVKRVDALYRKGYVAKVCPLGDCKYHLQILGW